MKIKYSIPIWKLISYQYSKINITRQHKLRTAFDVDGQYDGKSIYALSPCHLQNDLILKPFVF